ncbi:MULTISPECIES: hypothetical protein [Amycolatopsis]|uniref:hypothetical protein n=1 Tax=Amycolatopsis TaxID=1813 RepID=UPI0007E018E7|nr:MULTISPECIES: hypothetical protein [Amycolatopsis]OAP24818.1 hypothetical protein A4R44_04333 [Amycolatopsis sp. M39]
MFTNPAITASRTSSWSCWRWGIATFVRDDNVLALLFWDLLTLIHLGIRITRVP